MFVSTVSVSDDDDDGVCVGGGGGGAAGVCRSGFNSRRAVESIRHTTCRPLPPASFEQTLEVSCFLLMLLTREQHVGRPPSPMTFRAPLNFLHHALLLFCSSGSDSVGLWRRQHLCSRLEAGSLRVSPCTNRINFTLDGT